MRHNNHFIWYIPYYFLIFFSFYLGLKFVFIFFFIATYAPSFIFDFNLFFMMDGVEYIHLLLLVFITAFIDMYLHLTVSKKHLLYSLLFTSILICGIGMRIATVSLSMDYGIQYVIFSLLLLILVIDYRLYLIMPNEFTKISGSSNGNINPLVLSTTKPISPQVKKESINKQTSSFKQLIHARIYPSRHKSFQPTTKVDTSLYHLEKPVPKIPIDKSQKKPQIFKHTIEKETDEIKTTRQLLGKMGNYEGHFNKLDRNIEEIKGSNIQKIDFMGQMPRMVSPIKTLDQYKCSKILNNIPEGAVIISRGVVKAVNHSFTELVGRPTMDVLNHNFIDFVAPAGYQTYKSHFIQRLEGESSASFPIVLQSKKMDKIFLDVTLKELMIGDSFVEVTIFINRAI